MLSSSFRQSRNPARGTSRSLPPPPLRGRDREGGSRTNVHTPLGSARAEPAPPQGGSGEQGVALCSAQHLIHGGKGEGYGPGDPPHRFAARRGEPLSREGRGEEAPRL